MKKIIFWLVILALLGGATAYVLNIAKNTSELGGALYETRLPTFVKGIKAGSPATQVIDASGNWDGAVTGTTGSFSGAVTLTGETTLGNCGTATWNPGSLASSSVDGVSATTTDIAVTGMALGDVCMASLSSATSTAAVFSCNVSGTATGTITLANFGSAALDLATGTAKICYFD